MWRVQSEAMLKMQLLHMRDVDAQHAAVKALAHLVADVRSSLPCPARSCPL